MTETLPDARRIEIETALADMETVARYLGHVATMTRSGVVAESLWRAACPVPQIDPDATAERGRRAAVVERLLREARVDSES